MSERDGRPGDCWQQVAELEAELAETNQGVVALSLELEGYRAHLEELVAERTAELERARADLERANARLMEATDHATRANLAKSAFLANMSHELRTPLNAILGFTGLLRSPHTPAQQAEYLDIVDRSGTHLLGLINDVLDLAKIESGRLEPDWGAGDPAGIAADVVALLRGRAEAAGLDLALQVAADLPPAIRCDEVKVRQILLNLVANALRCTPSGSVHVVVEVSSAGSTPAVSWSVTDTGIGIADADLAAVFEPFRQVGTGTGGTGLGLPISRTYAELMGGSLTVSSRPGHGSTFRLLLPLVAVAAATQRPADDRIPCGIADGRIVRVVVAEDDPDSALLLSALLERMGVVATLTRDGEQAVAACARECPDLVFLDRRMPVLDGVQAARRIREQSAGHPPVIVAVTASALAEDHDTLQQAGVDEVIAKPYRPGRIAACLVERLGVRFRYPEEPPPVRPAGPVPVPVDALARLPAPTRRSLAEALVDLDPVTIEAAVAQVDRSDPEAGSSLRGLVAGWRHQEILDALDRLAGSAG